MVMKGVIKGIFMFIFCVVYAVLMFAVYKLMEMVEKRLGLNKVAFSVWNSREETGLDNEDQCSDISNCTTDKAMGELTQRIQESKPIHSHNDFYD